MAALNPRAAMHRLSGPAVSSDAPPPPPPCAPAGSEGRASSRSTAYAASERAPSTSQEREEALTSLRSLEQALQARGRSLREHSRPRSGAFRPPAPPLAPTHDPCHDARPAVAGKCPKVVAATGSSRPGTPTVGRSQRYSAQSPDPSEIPHVAEAAEAGLDSETKAWLNDMGIDADAHHPEPEPELSDAPAAPRVPTTRPWAHGAEDAHGPEGGPEGPRKLYWINTLKTGEAAVDAVARLSPNTRRQVPALPSPLRRALDQRCPGLGADPTPAPPLVPELSVSGGSRGPGSPEFMAAPTELSASTASLGLDDIDLGFAPSPEPQPQPAQPATRGFLQRPPVWRTGLGSPGLVVAMAQQRYTAAPSPDVARQLSMTPALGAALSPAARSPGEVARQLCFTDLHAPCPSPVTPPRDPPVRPLSAAAAATIAKDEAGGRGGLEAMERSARAVLRFTLERGVVRLQAQYATA